MAQASAHDDYDPRHDNNPGDNPMFNRRHLLGALAAAGCLSFGAAHAQGSFPNGPIRFVVPYPPGGPTDLMARMLQPELQKRLGVNVIIENKGGAGGNVGSSEVAKQAPADGQTLLLAASGPMAVNSSLFKSMTFSALNDLAPVVQLSAFPLVLEVHPSVEVKNLKDFIAQAKTQKDPFTYASAGNGTPQHLAGELFSRAADVKMTHIPYRGAGPALSDLIGGQVKVMFDVLGSSLQHIESGKLKPHRGDLGQAQPGAAQRADVGRSRPAQLRDHRLARRGGARRYPRADRRQAQRHLPRHLQGPGLPQEMGGARHRRGGRQPR